MTNREATRIRVARVITRLNIGGPAAQAMLLTRWLDPRRYESLLICGTAAPREGDMRQLRPEPVSATVIPALSRRISPVSDARALVELVRLFRRHRPHIVHTHLAKAGALGRVAARLAGVPIVLHTFHGNVFRGYFDVLRTRAFIAIERVLGRLSTRVISISPRQRQELLELGIVPADRIVEIPLGLDLAPFLDSPRGRLREELGVGRATPLVGIVARLVPIKGVDMFLDAAAHIARRRSDVVFVVVGDGELREHLEARAAQLGIRDRLRLLGWRSDLPVIYGDLDVVVLTSRNEGTPVSLIEALAAGRPVVATDVGGVPDLLGRAGERGVLIDPDDSRGAADAVLALLSDLAAGEEIGQRGRLFVYPEFDIATLVRRIDRLYADLCSSRRLS